MAGPRSTHIRGALAVSPWLAGQPSAGPAVDTRNGVPEPVPYVYGGHSTTDDAAAEAAARKLAELRASIPGWAEWDAARQASGEED